MKKVELKDIELNKIYVAVSRAEASISNKCFIVINNDTKDKNYKYLLIEGTYKYVYNNLKEGKISHTYRVKSNNIIDLIKENIVTPYYYNISNVELEVYDIEDIEYIKLDNEKFNKEVLKYKDIISNEVSKHLKILEDLRSTIIDNDNILKEYKGVPIKFKQLVSLYNDEVVLEDEIDLDHIPSLKGILNTSVEDLLDTLDRDKYIYIKDSLRITPELDYDGDCCSICNTRYVIDGYKCSMPSDNIINNLAIKFVLYNNISKVFNTPECTIIKQYLDGDLTWKGLLKHIDIKHTIVC